MDKIITGIEMQFKSLRIYLLELFLVVFVMPFSYAFVVLLSSGTQNVSVSYLLSGYIVSTLISTFLGMLALSITNLRQKEVLELYSTYAITFPQVVTTVCLTYVLIVLPIILVVMPFIVIHSASVNYPVLLVATIISIFFLLCLSVYLGLSMKNLFIANGFLQLISWVLILFSPIYYNFQNLSTAFKYVLLINPITHLLNIIRVPLGFAPMVNVWLSYVYVGLLIALMLLYISKHVRSTYILEKIF
jgi:ABC-2 type transport system permease protein